MEELIRECPNTQLKEVEKRKRDSRSRVSGAIAVFLKAKAVVSLHENSQDCLKILQFSWKTSASPRQCRDIMAQISIDAFHCKSVILVVYIENMLPRKNHIPISIVSIRTILFRFRRRVHHFLNGVRGFLTAHGMAHDLPRFSAYHGNDVDIFPGFCPGLALQKPV